MEKKQALIPLIIAMAVILATGFLTFLNLFGGWEQKVYDDLMFLQGEQNFRDDIVIVGITEEDLAALGQWPFPRDYHAKLIDNLTKNGAAAIGIDIILSEPSSDKKADQELVGAARRSGKVIMGVYGKLLSSSRLERSFSATNLTRPFPSLAKVTHQGVINVIPDSDGILRKVILLVKGTDNYLPSFELELLKLKGVEVEHGQDGKLIINDRPVPTDYHQRIMVNFIGPAETFPIIPYKQVLEGNFPENYFQDKIVLVGATTVGLYDSYLTPFSQQQMHGIEFHANALQTVLDHNFKQPLPLAANLGIMIVASSILSLFFYYSSSWLGIIILGAFSLGFLLLDCFFFHFYNVYLEVIPSLLAAFSIYLLLLIYKFIQEQKEKKRVTQLFGRYVASSVVDKILDGAEEEVQLGGIRQEITVLFMDIRGFTPLSEKLTPEDVVKILNSFLNIVVEVVFEKEGTLDKFIGDAAMVIYNAPLPVADHTLRAVETAEAIMERIAGLQEELINTYGRTIEFGFGINTGEAVVGNIGSQQRMEYTAIGDTVNLAARLESLAKPREILISPEVCKRVEEYYLLEHLGQKQIKGKSQLLDVYKIRGRKGGKDDETLFQDH